MLLSDGHEAEAQGRCLARDRSLVPSLAPALVLLCTPVHPRLTAGEQTLEASCQVRRHRLDGFRRPEASSERTEVGAQVAGGLLSLGQATVSFAAGSATRRSARAAIPSQTLQRGRAGLVAQSRAPPNHGSLPSKSG